MKRRSLLRASLLAATTMSAERALAGSLLKPKVAPKATRFMNYTILSSGATLRAWSDVAFRELLISNPRQALGEFWTHQPSEANFVVHENTEDATHLSIPWRMNEVAELSMGALSDVIAHETGDDRTLEYFLPASILARAIVDAEFRHRLVKAPKTVLFDNGYNTEMRTLVVHENSSTDYHIALPRSPSSLRRLEAMDRHILLYAQAATTKCCASGTCDIRPGGGGSGGCLSCHGGNRVPGEQAPDFPAHRLPPSPFPYHPQASVEATRKGVTQ